ncbi:MAG: NRDE family protein [Woeseiaceae bacterium]|nr:NRDE family protein [Woeseiaceae bacterium]
MCLVVVAHRAHADFPLVLAGNRDEFHARPTQDARWWPDRPDVLGGRDLQAGGTWLALHRNGRFAVVTNFRDAVPPVATQQSRGHLITGFLDGSSLPMEFVRDIDGQRYGGFNLLVGNGDTLAYLSNRDGACRELSPGIYGVANATLDTPWPKVERSKARLQSLLDAGRLNETSLLRLLADREKARAHEVESGDLPFTKAHALTAPFIVLPDYGTRSSSVVIRDRDGRTRFTEQRFAPDGTAIGRSDFQFRVTSSTP